MHPPAQRTTFPPTQTASLPPPPGLLGEIARHIFNSSQRPVPEVAIVAALGLIAGISGKAFQIDQHGLNVRIIFIAQSCIVEAAIKHGIGSIVSTVASCYPTITQFVDFTIYANGEALNKALALQPFFANVVGEFGAKLTRMTKSQSSRVVALRAAMEHPDKTTPSGYSLIGETTPSRLREMLTASVLESDFVHGFMVVEYTGDLPLKNEHLEQQLSEELRYWVIKLCEMATSNVANHQRTPVQVDHEAAPFLIAFNALCDAGINGTTNDARRRMLDQAHRKVLRVAALVAVADNCVHPFINIAHATWARDLVLRDIAVMSRHIGDARITGKKRVQC